MRRRAEDCLHAIWRTRGLASTLLMPLAWLYGYLSARRMTRQAAVAWRAPVPVLVIGNILVGGTGKTPLAIAVCRALRQSGWQPGLVSRGYGASIGTRPHLSDQDGSATYLGDEPALLHASTGAPLAVHPRRALAAHALLAAHPEVDVLIADDGLQHRTLARDLELIVQDARGTGNGRLLPAGPLREPPARLEQADWLITNLAPGDRAPLPPDTPAGGRHLTMRLQPRTVVHLASGQSMTWENWHTQHGKETCSAAAGIGHPDRFFAMLRAEGVRLSHTLCLPDHGSLTPAELAALPPAPILITAKDAVKCPVEPDPRLWVIQVEPVFSSPDWLTALDGTLRGIADRLAHKQGDRH